MAFLFLVYSVTKKQAPLNTLYGMTLETAVLFPPALIYLIVLQVQGVGAFGHGDVCTICYLLVVVFRIPITLLGILQYIFPSVMFIVGVIIYNEAFSTSKLIGFCIIWAAVALYLGDEFVYYKNHPKPATIQTPRETDSEFDSV
ncbi:hypothetical protein THRCLA_23153 [Thraustotheca clavata]|uniref:Uncharacterized protein n=1 Tax=Thraustotheca clavata TaxID=74557 RepID=A0A1V9YCG7_9STRA|nr:hypothetical protein THRCLA_23153 [Thraustotheca clavata]